MLLAQFMLENILWSVKLAIRAARGESIDEVGDVDKEIALFVRRHRGDAPSESDVEKLDYVVHRWIRPMQKSARKALQPLGQLFTVEYWNAYRTVGEHSATYGWNLFAAEQWNRTKEDSIVKPGFRLTSEQKVDLGLNLRLDQYSGQGERGFSISLTLNWRLGDGGVVFVAEIDHKPIESSVCLVPYPELQTHGFAVDRTVDTICKAMIDEITLRSGVEY